MADFGGEIRLTIGGVPFVLRGTFQLDPTNVVSKDMTNMDGSICRQFTPNAYGADLKSLQDNDRPGIDWNALIRGPAQAIVLVEELTGVTHNFGQAYIIGQPSIDRESGEVTGLQIRSPTYNKKAF